MLLSTRNLKMKDTTDKLKIQQRSGQQAYRLLLPETWKVHPVFHISLLKKWTAADLQEEEELLTEELEVEEPYYEIKKILWRRKAEKGR